MVARKNSRPNRRKSRLSTEEQLALAIEALSEHVVLFDAEDRIVLANRAWRELNRSIIEFTRPGTRFEDHLRAALDHGLVPEAIGCEDMWLRRRMERHLHPTGPFELERQDGRWIRIHEQRIPNGGMILIVSDVTETRLRDQALRESEERFRAVVNYSPAKIHIKDAEGRYILINSLAAKLFGVTESDVRGKTTHEVFPEETADAFVAHDRQVMEGRTAVEQEEHWFHDGEVRTFLTIKFPILNDDGHVTGVGAMGTDISDRKRAERRLQESERALQMRVAELEEAHRRLKQQEDRLIALTDALARSRDQEEAANRAKSEFLAAVSHELRTPLNAIIGFSDVTRSERLGPVGNPKYREYATDIHEAGQHLLALINDILDLSKIESGMDELHEEEIAISELVPSVLRLVRERARTRRIDLRADMPQELPALTADERKLKQVLVNLLSNAIKFTEPDGEVELRVRCGRDGSYVFEVADSGVGIAVEDIPRAMAQFGQVESTLSRQHQGTGLGLPLSKALVEQHGGTLELHSKVGAGTTVTVRLPCDRTVRVPRRVRARAG